MTFFGHPNIIGISKNRPLLSDFSQQRNKQRECFCVINLNIGEYAESHSQDWLTSERAKGKIIIFKKKKAAKEGAACIY